MLSQILAVYGDETGETGLLLPILGVTPKDSLIVRKVTGLNPADINLFIGDYARDGGSYQGRRVGNRNVVLTIDLNPNPALGETVSGLRELLYKIFVDPLVDADYTRLVFISDDNTSRQLYGYVEKFETELFEIETMVQISIICPDPYIRDLVDIELTNPTGTWLSVPFTYTGTAETGFYTRINVTADTPTVTLKNNEKTMVVNYPFLAGDILYIDTNRGQRDIYMMRGAVKTPMFPYMTSTSKWLELHSQVNTMSVYGVAPANTVAGVKTLIYRPAYWGM